MIKETKWLIDQAHSTIEFKVRHLMIANVKGEFRKFDANIYTTAKDFTTAEIDLCIDAASISTGDEKRDEHLKTAEFLDAKNHKQITFTASSISPVDADGNRKLWGELTIKGISKNVELNVQFGGIVKDPWGHEKAGFSVAGKLNRSDWGLTWNSTMDNGGFLLSDEITILCDIELIKVNQNDLKWKWYLWLIKMEGSINCLLLK